MLVTENGPKHSIDKLPDLQRRAVIQAIMNEVPLRDVAKMAGCSLGSVHRYKQQFVIPTLQDHKINLWDQQVEALPKLNADERKAIESELCPEVIQNTQLEQLERRGTKVLMRASPVKSRAEKLWRFTARNLGRAQKAQRTVAMPDGSLAPVGQDFGVLAPLLNQAHKNLEIQGRLSGELIHGNGAGGGPSVAIQIVMPGQSAGASPIAETVTIDVSDGHLSAKIGGKK